MKFYLTCRKFTIKVVTDEDDKIIEAAPIVRKFVGQPFANLVRWVGRITGEKPEVVEL